MRVNERVIWIALVVFLVTIIGGIILIFNTDLVPGAGAQSDEYDELIPIFNEAYQKIMDRFVDVDKLDTQELFYGAIRGMVESLGDPHSAFYDPEFFKEVTEDIEGTFAGIGAYIIKKDDQIEIVKPIEGTPAAQAGIRPRDIIIEINGQSTEGFSSMKAASLIKGEPGTDVTLKIKRPGKIEPIEITITRAIIEIPVVKYKILENDIGYIRLISFSNTSPQAVRNAMTDLMSKSMEYLILDIRDNPGGTLDAGKEISDIFLKESKIVYTVGREEQVRQTLYAEEDQDDYIDIPLILLVNENSASASEILAGALKDTQRALLVGNKTYGKGSVQSFMPLNESNMEKMVGLKITIAYWYTPSGELIDGQGIEPDILIKESEEELIDRLFYENKLYEENLIEEFLKDNPKFTKEDVKEFKQKLEEEYHIFLSINRIGELLYNEKNRYNTEFIVDTEYDKALTKAIQIFKEGEYEEKELISYE